MFLLFVLSLADEIKIYVYNDNNCCVFQHIPNCIVSIHSMGNRIIVSDNQDSFHFVRYKRTENQLIVFADDTNQRWITSACLLDYDTIAGADKFGNITVVRSLLHNVR